MRTKDFLLVYGIARVGGALIGLGSIPPKDVWGRLVPARRPGAEGVELVATELGSALLASAGGKL